MKKLIIYTLILGSLSACDKLLLPEETPNTPTQNFEILWQEYNEKYGLFRVKNINWDSVYQLYRPQIHDAMSDAEFYKVCTQMLEGLNDCHVLLIPTSSSGLTAYQSGVLGKIDSINDFSLEIIKDNYLNEEQFEDPFFTYGKLEGNLGYMHIEGFSDLPNNLKKPMNVVMEALKDTKGLIIDVRGGYGGEDLAGMFLAGYFTDQKRLYMQTRVKNGPGSNDFTPTENWEITPSEELYYDKPIIVLTHRYTISARETFCLAMKPLPQVSFYGDTTAGAFSNQINRELPNGWGYSVSIGEWFDAEGKSHEGIGLIPDVLVRNKKEDLLLGKDELLETAILNLR